MYKILLKPEGKKTVIKVSNTRGCWNIPSSKSMLWCLVIKILIWDSGSDW